MDKLIIIIISHVSFLFKCFFCFLCCAIKIYQHELHSSLSNPHGCLQIFQY